MEKLIIRSDDFDFRMIPEFYIAVHEHFIANDLIETAVVQITQHGRLFDFGERGKMEIINYMNTAPNWDIQFHCWAHDAYGEMEYSEVARDVSAGLFHFQKLFNKLPTVWYPPHNARSEEMERAAGLLGLRIDNEDMPIRRFVDKVGWVDGKFQGHSLYFHSWKHQEMEYFEEMIKLAVEIKNGTPEI